MADVSIFSGFAGFSGWGTILKLIVLIIIPLLFVAVGVTALVILFLVKKKQIKIVEIGMNNKRVRMLTGRIKKTPKGTEQLYVGKLKRYLPTLQTQDVMSLKGRDIVFLLKDDNGFYHTLRIPTFNQLTEYYKQVHNVDLSTSTGQEWIKKKQLIDYDRLYNVYMMPNPHEDLDWLASQIVEANKEFMIDKWWKSPVIAYIGVGAVCMIMWVMTMILTGKFVLV